MLRSVPKYAAVAAMVCAFAIPNSASAQHPDVTFKHATGFPKALYMGQPAEFFGKRLAEETGGKVKIKYFYSGSLGKANELLDLVKTGAIDMGAVVQGYFTSALPFAAMSNSLPLTFFDPEQIMLAARELEGTNPSQIDELKRNNVVFLLHRYLPNYKLICTKPVRTMADLKKLKVRTFGNYMPKMFAAIGVTPVNVLPTENYEALKRGSMDCSYLTNANFLVYKLHEVAKYIIDVKFGGIHAFPLAMNRKKFESLPKATQDVMIKVGKEATKFATDQTESIEAAALKTMLSQGAELIKFEEQDQLVKAVPNMVDLWVDAQSNKAAARKYADEIMAIYKKNAK